MEYTLDLPIYPGHPMTLACQIAQAFPTLAAAHKPTESGWPEALGNDKVDGAGGYVYAALQALDMLADGTPLETVLAWSDSIVRSEAIYRDMAPAACEQARRYLAQTDVLVFVQRKEGD